MPTNATSNEPLYFPPPPTSVIKNTDSKKPLKLNLSKSRSSKESTVTITSVEDAPKAILKKKITSTKRTRQWILLGLLILSFTILILSTIFAYCAALPHSDNIAAAQAAAASATSSSTPVTSTVSLISVSATTSTSNPASTDAYPSRLLVRDAPTYNDPQSLSVEAALAEDATNQKKFGTSSAMAALTFYTATLPFLTMIHTSVELLLSLIRPETSQATRLGDAFRFQRAGADVDARGVVTRRRTGTLLSFSASALLCLGWLIMQMFWMNCEVATFGGNTGGEQVCPVQIRGHRMGGVSELSIGKVVLGFVVILGYAGYCLYLVKQVGVFSSKSSMLSQTASGSRMSSFRRRARFASRTGSDEDQRGDVESVVIAIGMDKETS